MSNRTDELRRAATTTVAAETGRIVDAAYVRLLEAEVDSLTRAVWNPTQITPLYFAKTLAECFPTQKIMCIKAMRSMFAMSLLDAKGAIDEAFSNLPLR